MTEITSNNKMNKQNIDKEDFLAKKYYRFTYHT